MKDLREELDPNGFRWQSQKLADQFREFSILDDMEDRLWNGIGNYNESIEIFVEQFLPKRLFEGA